MASDQILIGARSVTVPERSGRCRGVLLLATVDKQLHMHELWEVLHRKYPRSQTPGMCQEL